MALCEIQWAINFYLTQSKEINYVDEIINFAIATGTPFSELNYFKRKNHRNHRH